MSPVLVIAAGNEMRGDDAAGPRLIEFVASQSWSHVRTLQAFQFQVEHAVDVSDASLVLFIDAHADQQPALVLNELLRGEAPGAASHALSPAQVLGVVHQLRLDCPPCFVLTVAGHDFSLGAAMSKEVDEACRLAESVLVDLLASPDVSRWQIHACLQDLVNSVE